MKNLFTAKLAAGAFLAALLCGPLVHASPIPISGSISFLGNATLNTTNLATASSFTSFMADSVNQVSGDYSVLPALTGDSVTFTPFTFYTGGGVMSGGFRFSSTPVATPLSTSPLWTFTAGGVTYSFMATGTITVIQNSSFLDISGDGIAMISGGTTNYVPTDGEWTIQETKSGSSFSFGGTAVAIPPAEGPDGASTALLMAIGLGGLFGLQVWRKRVTA